MRRYTVLPIILAIRTALPVHGGEAPDPLPVPLCEHLRQRRFS